jgi:hypothetical protein
VIGSPLLFATIASKWAISSFLSSRISDPP